MALNQSQVVSFGAPWHLDNFFSTILVKIVNASSKNSTSGGWLAGNNINRNHLNLFYWLLSL